MSNFSTRLMKYNADDFLTSRNNEDFIGKGRFGTVLSCEHNELGVVAVKCFELRGSKVEFKKITDMVEREANMLSYFRHSNVVQVLGITEWLFNVAIVLELVEGSANVKVFLSSEKVHELPWCVRLQISQNIVAGLSYIHSYKPNKAFCHGDLKAENVLLTKQLEAKLADFGAAALQKAADASTVTLEITPTRQGTTLYSAPELLKNSKMEKSPATDMYSFGILLYEIITREVAYKDYVRRDDLAQQIIDGARPNEDLVEHCLHQIDTDQDQTIGSVLGALMSKCWSVNPNERSRSSSVNDQLTSLSQTMSGPNTAHEVKKISNLYFENQIPCSRGERVKLSSLSFPFMAGCSGTDSQNTYTDDTTPTPTLNLLETPSLHQQSQSQDIEMQDVTRVDVHDFVMVLKVSKESLYDGSVCLYSYKSCFLDDCLWKITVLPTRRYLAKGMVEQISLLGSCIPSEWEKAKDVVKKAFTGCPDVDGVNLSAEERTTEEKVKQNAKSLTFTLRGKGFEQQVKKTVTRREDNCIIRTGPVTAYVAYQCVHGIIEPFDSIREPLLPDLLNCTLLLGDIFGRDLVVHVSYCNKTDDWKEYARIQ